MSDLSPHNGILVGHDGSPCSKTAVQWAARAAAMRNVPLTVVVVFRPVDGWSGMVLSMVPFPEDIGQMQEAEGRRIIEDAIEIVNTTTRDSGRLQVNSEVLWSPLVPTLVDLTKEAQMIVVGCLPVSRTHPCSSALTACRSRSWPPLLLSMKRHGAGSIWSLCTP